MYMIMSFVMGFTGNKLFNKKDKGSETSIKCGAITGIVMLVIYYILKIK